MAFRIKGLSKTAQKSVLRQARSAMAEPDLPAPERPDVPEGLDWHNRFSSSNVAAMAYMADFHRLFIRFKSGSVYRYENVEPGMYQGFQSAPSKGRWVYWVLRNGGRDDQYAYSRVA